MKTLLRMTALATGTIAALALAACSSPGAPAATESASSSGAPAGTITVFAAASLQQTFTTLGDRFEQAHRAPPSGSRSPGRATS